MTIAGDGTSWEKAFQTMEGAIDNPLLRSGDAIWVKSGRYAPTYEGWNSGPGTYDQGAGLTIKKTIRVFGGFPAGMEAPQWINRDWKSNETIIDADTQYWYERQRCFYIRGDSNSFSVMGDVVIDGFVITNGRQSGGSGVFIENSNVTISNCIITGNYGRPGAYEYGGGIKVSGPTSAATIFNCVISGNWAQYGAAIAFVGVAASAEHHPRVINCTITGNRTTGVDGYVFPVAPTIFQYWAYEARLDIVNTILWNNATDPSGTEIGFVDTTVYGIYENNPDQLTVSYSDIHGGSGQLWFDALTDIDSDPRLVQLGHWEDNGTPEDTRDDYWIRGDERLQAGSPCIDAGDDGSVLMDVLDWDDDGDTNESAPFDLAYGPRFLGLVNIGAYELTAAPEIDLDGDGDLDADDLAILALDFGASECGAETCAGDLDQDSDLDGSDLAAFAGAF